MIITIGKNAGPELRVTIAPLPAQQHPPGIRICRRHSDRPIASPDASARHQVFRGPAGLERRDDLRAGKDVSARGPRTARQQSTAGGAHATSGQSQSEKSCLPSIPSLMLPSQPSQQARLCPASRSSTSILPAIASRSVSHSRESIHEDPVMQHWQHARRSQMT